MATKKTAPKKTTGTSKAKVAPKKKVTAAKKAVKKAPAKKKAMKAGDSYECSVCGLEVSVDKVCGCADACDIMCCGEPMEII